ncbi:cysteine desulfurase family protein [Lutibacter sp.]|uniref:cysteine desulfurase family protein n=1 Tax=Lutibacter sp. TaxID=1925666 RepID=UPI0025C1D616|nr:cysteine desulfurase family protein [Lutibacter sp.]MCF6182190.1 cysteine desulfurase [Lutibacter sp.]
MKTIYLDNAATTPMLPEVIESVTAVMKSTYGNPSSTHQIGRKSRALVENARKSIANLLNASSSELFFTAGGSEADNLILHNAVTNLEVKTIISSKIEHHAIIHTIEHLKEKYNIEVKWVNLTSKGSIDYNHLEELLENTLTKTLVSLMYVNNEIGNILDLKKVSNFCIKNKVLFHSDTVQGIAHFDIDVVKTPIDFFTASAHKFHGPKGVGYAYIKKGFGVQPLLFGGEQEKGARAGTENIHSIYGMQKAMEIACKNLEEEAKSIQAIKSYFITSLKSNFEGIKFNGLSESETESSYIILNVRFSKAYPMLLFNLDLKGIAVSGGSACQSGSSKGSHVLHEILEEKETLKTSVRFSFSKFTSKTDIDYVISILKDLIK